MIDLCVAINGINLDVLVPMFFETFFKKVSADHFHVHAVLKNVDPRIYDYIEKKADEVEIPFSIYELDGPFYEETGPGKEEVLWMGGDTAITCEWMMENCGDNQWVVISHFDVAFENDFAQALIPEMTSVTGMIGYHRDGIVAINRDAYKQCFVGFRSMNNFFASKENGKYKLRFEMDPRCKDKSIRIEGFDVAELLELNIQARRWRTIPWPDLKIEHIGAGSGYHKNEGTAKNQRLRATALLNKDGISPICL